MTKEDLTVQWAQKELTKYLDCMIIPQDRKHISVFGAYELYTSPSRVEVWENQDLCHVFRDTRTALSFCVAKKLKKYSLANDIVVLDQQRSSVSQDIKARQAIARRSKSTAFRISVLDKLDNKIRHLQTVSNQLEKCIKVTKYLHLQGFQNEIARTRCI